MNKKALWSIFFILLCGNLYPQTIDNDIRNWENISIQSPSDLFEVRSYFDQYEEFSLDKRLKFNQKIYDGAKRLDIDSVVAAAAFRLGNYYHIQDSSLEAFRYVQEAFNLKNKLQNPGLVGGIANLLGIIYNDAGQLEDALEAYFVSLEAFLEYDPNYRSYPLGNISELYSTMGDYEKAIDYTLEAVELSKKLDSPEYEYNYGFDSYRLSAWYLKLGKVDSAAFYLNKSIELALELDTTNDARFKELLFLVYENATCFYLEEKQQAKAAASLRKAEIYVENRTQSKLLLLQGKYFLAQNNKSRTLAIAEIPEIQSNEFEVKKEHLLFKIEAFEHFGELNKVINCL